MDKILLLNGINLNMLGKRPKEHYGTLTLKEIEDKLIILAKENQCELECFTTNDEGKMVERIHASLDEDYLGIIINPGAWTHYSYGIRDALEMLDFPIIEVHLSDIEKRESFRKYSVIRDITTACFMGEGIVSYEKAFHLLLKKYK